MLFFENSKKLTVHERNILETKEDKKYDFFGSTKWIKKDELFVLQAEKIQKYGIYFLQTMVEI